MQCLGCFVWGKSAPMDAVFRHFQLWVSAAQATNRSGNPESKLQHLEI